MRVDLLVLLADKLENPLPEGLVFDMDIWFQPAPDRPSCKTSGCAAYIASTIPEIAAHGLAMVPGGNADSWDFIPQFRGKNDPRNLLVGIKECFELAKRDAKYIFLPFYGKEKDDGPEDRNTPQAVAARIREVIERHEGCK